MKYFKESFSSAILTEGKKIDKFYEDLADKPFNTMEEFVSFIKSFDPTPCVKQGEMGTFVQLIMKTDAAFFMNQYEKWLDDGRPTEPNRVSNIKEYLEKFLRFRTSPTFPPEGKQNIPKTFKEIKAMVDTYEESRKKSMFYGPEHSRLIAENENWELRQLFTWEAIASFGVGSGRTEDGTELGGMAWCITVPGNGTGHLERYGGLIINPVYMVLPKDGNKFKKYCMIPGKGGDGTINYAPDLRCQNNANSWVPLERSSGDRRSLKELIGEDLVNAYKKSTDEWFNFNANPKLQSWQTIGMDQMIDNTEDIIKRIENGEINVFSIDNNEGCDFQMRLLNWIGAVNKRVTGKIKETKVKKLRDILQTLYNKKEYVLIYSADMAKYAIDRCADMETLNLIMNNPRKDQTNCRIKALGDIIESYLLVGNSLENLNSEVMDELMKTFNCAQYAKKSLESRGSVDNQLFPISSISSMLYRKLIESIKNKTAPSQNWFILWTLSPSDWAMVIDSGIINSYEENDPVGYSFIKFFILKGGLDYLEEILATKKVDFQNVGKSKYTPMFYFMVYKTASPKDIELLMDSGLKPYSPISSTDDRDIAEYVIDSGVGSEYIKKLKIVINSPDYPHEKIYNNKKRLFALANAFSPELLDGSLITKDTKMNQTYISLMDKLANKGAKTKLDRLIFLALSDLPLDEADPTLAPALERLLGKVKLTSKKSAKKE